MQRVYIISSTRTPIGSFGGIFSGIPATKLGATAIQGAISRAEVPHTEINEVFMGNVVSANLGQAPAKQASRYAEIPDNVPCTLINKVCASGTKAIMLAAQSIMLGQNEITVAGGMENMSMIPYYIPKARFGYKYGSSELIDGLQKDGLADAYDHSPMGISADNTAKKYDISREEQDNYAISSYKRAAEATEKGWFKKEITPVSVPQRKGVPLLVDTDEEFKKVKFEKIPHLRPAFTKDGTVTAANASTINDGASALVLAGEEYVKANGLKPIAEVIAFADAAVEPKWFTTAPVPAAKKAINKAKLSLDDINLFEVNEAFSVVPLFFEKQYKIPHEKMNIFGGAVSLGHPLGASGARIVTTLINALQQSGSGEMGCASICNGGGGASSIIVKAM
ncbi:thiolase family protein [Membranihabitans maritimus]|uniref:thiolase family protein n=1 Tax=Membranihabitans maritimus TaxID=2904244 RepID=UPI001F37239A|nr:thiolase family protein [Membranihabitans maritimus]